MTERQILFSGPMVRAILSGRKTQTRRVVQPQPSGGWEKSPYVQAGRWCSGGFVSDLKCPYGQPGDRLWVREAWAHVPITAYRCSAGVQQTADPTDADMAAVYRCGWERCRPGRWRPSIHMPRWASRITLEVVCVSVERVQDITEADARAEGLEPGPGPDGLTTAKTEFWLLWNAIHAKRGAGWDANPWVWVIEFRRVDKEA